VGKRVLVIEDEISIQRILQYELKQSNFLVDIASDGEEGLKKALATEYDVILLDVMLPNKDGFSVCKELREKNNSTYVVMLSARDEEFNRVLGLDVGADDYMTKPFSTREVVSKVKAIIRRKEMAMQPSEENKDNAGLTYCNLKLNPNRFEVSVENQIIDFTLKEYELLAYLIGKKGKALSRDELLDKLWGIEYFGDTRVVDVHIFKIRDKLKPHGMKIKTIRGVGYMLEDEVND